MKKNAHPIPSDRGLNVKEISDGVYINLNRITSDEKEFEKAIEESFKELQGEKKEDEELDDDNAENKKYNSKSVQSRKSK
jgi:lipoate-protein ligase A